MCVKKDKWSSVKEILFTYLAINKIMYWFDTIMAMNPGDVGFGGVARAVMLRLLSGDLIMIAGIVMFFFLDKLISQKKSKGSSILEAIKFYVIGYVALLALQLIYLGIASLFVPIEWSSFVSVMPYFTLGYIVVVVVLNLKYYFKEKEKSGYTPSAPSTEDKLSMLQVLLDDGTLSQEEFDQKKLLYM